MEMRHIKCFQMVASEKSMSKASAKLNTSQPSVSRCIKDIEEEVGAVLFYRKKNGMCLTPSGQRFSEYANRILTTLNDAVFSIRKTNYYSGVINIGFCPSVIIFSFLEAMRQKTFFNIRKLRFFEQSSADQIKMLRQGALDVGIIRHSEKMQFDDLECVRFMKLETFAVIPASHVLSGKNALTLEELKDNKFVVLSQALFLDINSMLMKSCESAGFAPNIIFEANGFFAALAMIATGECVGLFPQYMPNYVIPGFVYIPLFNNTYSLGMAYIHRKNEKNKSVTNFIDNINQCYSHVVK